MPTNHTDTDERNCRRRTRDTTVAFVCVQNAGRSQMSAALAERERDRRGFDSLEILTGGTHPADSIHDVVVEAMAELDIDLSERTPREISQEDLSRCDHVVTMGCSTLELAVDAVIVHDWKLDDPHGEDLNTVREIREDIADRVTQLLDSFADSRSDPHRDR